jgi:hypothetical protein
LYFICIFEHRGIGQVELLDRFTVSFIGVVPDNGPVVIDLLGDQRE